MNDLILIRNFKSEIWGGDPPFSGGTQVLSTKFCVCLHASVFIFSEWGQKKSWYLSFICKRTVFGFFLAFLCLETYLAKGWWGYKVGMGRIQQSLWMTEHALSPPTPPLSLSHPTSSGFMPTEMPSMSLAKLTCSSPSRHMCNKVLNY